MLQYPLDGGVSEGCAGALVIQYPLDGGVSEGYAGALVLQYPLDVGVDERYRMLHTCSGSSVSTRWRC